MSESGIPPRLVPTGDPSPSAASRGRGMPARLLYAPAELLSPSADSEIPPVDSQRSAHFAQGHKPLLITGSVSDIDASGRIRIAVLDGREKIILQTRPAIAEKLKAGRLVRVEIPPENYDRQARLYLARADMRGSSGITAEAAPRPNPSPDSATMPPAAAQAPPFAPDKIQQSNPALPPASPSLPPETVESMVRYPETTAKMAEYDEPIAIEEFVDTQSSESQYILERSARQNSASLRPGDPVTLLSFPPEASHMIAPVREESTSASIPPFAAGSYPGDNIADEAYLKLVQESARNGLLETLSRVLRMPSRIDIAEKAAFAYIGGQSGHISEDPGTAEQRRAGRFIVQKAGAFSMSGFMAENSELNFARLSSSALTSPSPPQILFRASFVGTEGRSRPPLIRAGQSTLTKDSNTFSLHISEQRGGALTLPTSSFSDTSGAKATFPAAAAASSGPVIQPRTGSLLELPAHKAIFAGLRPIENKADRWGATQGNKNFLFARDTLKTKSKAPSHAGNSNFFLQPASFSPGEGTLLGQVSFLAQRYTPLLTYGGKAGSAGLMSGQNSSSVPNAANAQAISGTKVVMGAQIQGLTIDGLPLVQFMDSPFNQGAFSHTLFSNADFRSPFGAKGVFMTSARLAGPLPPIGSIISFSFAQRPDISPHFTAGSPLPPIGLPPLQPGPWDSMTDISKSLFKAGGSVAETSQALMPNAASPGRIPAAALFFLAALRSGEVPAWLGNTAQNTVRKMGKDGVLEALRSETEIMAGRTRGTAGEWKTHFFPLLWGEEVSKIALWTRQEPDSDHEKKQDKDRKNKKEATRFVFDMSLQKIGNLQIDGLARSGNKLDIVLRSEKMFSSPLRQHMRRKYLSVLEQSGYKGELHFHLFSAASVKDQKEKIPDSSPGRMF